MNAERFSLGAVFKESYFFADSVASVFSCFSPSIELELGLSGHPVTPFLKHKIKLISVNKILSFSKLH